MPNSVLPFSSLFNRTLKDLAIGQSVAIVGLSNSGKSSLARNLSTRQAEQVFQSHRQHPGSLVYIDCNQAVALSAQGFYEVVLRALLEGLDRLVTEELRHLLQNRHETVVGAETPFSASLAFNLALTELIEQFDRDLVLIFDEFDEIYTALDERTLLNLRALHDRFPNRLVYVSVTVRALPTLRGKAVEGEFAELFSHSTYTMPLLSPEEAESILEGFQIPGLTEGQRAICLELAGGHPGLLTDMAALINQIPEGSQEEVYQSAVREAQIRAECLKIWEQLTSMERDALTLLVLEEGQGGLEPRQRSHLENLGLLEEGEIFSPLLADFVARRRRREEVGEEGIFLDNDSGDVWVDGIRIPVLTDLEFRLLQLFYKRMDKLTDKYKIVTSVWGEEYLQEVDDARVEKLVSRLRSKIEPDPSNPRYLITRRGRGYKLLKRPLHPVEGSN